LGIKLQLLKDTEDYLKVAYFDPARKEKTFPSLFLGLMQNSARSFILVGKNGSEPMTGIDGRAGGNV